MPVQFTKQFLLEQIYKLPRSVSNWEDSPCLIWPFSKNRQGYGTVWDNKECKTSHRFAYEHFYAVQLGKQRIQPLCGNRGCFNPLHFVECRWQIDFLRSSIHALTDDLTRPWSDYPCMEWPFYKYTNRYGGIRVSATLNKPSILVHRKAYEFAFGPIEDGLQVLHRCDNPPCYRPIHLFKGTQLDNVHDMIAKGRAKNWNRPRPDIRGELNRNAILTWAIVDEMRRRYAAGERSCDIADSLNLWRGHAHAILKNKAWIRELH